MIVTKEVPLKPISEKDPMSNDLLSIDSRDDSCANGTYHDKDTRLNFGTFCDLAFNGLDLPNGRLDEVSAEDCMWRCAGYSELTGCWGVSFSPPSTCLLKGKGISLKSSGAHSEPGSTLGLVSPTSQMEPSPLMKPECPYPNGSTVPNTVPPMNFEIFCNSDLDAPGWVTGLLDTPNEHFDNLYDCLHYCAVEGTPQCQAAVFDPTMSHGYQNCFPKMVSIQNASSALVPQTDPPRHVAVAKIPEIDSSCTEGDVVGSAEGKHFKLSCDQDGNGDDIEEAFHTNSLEECTAECARYIGPTPADNCVAVTWDPLMRKVYANCYRKKSTGTPLTMSGMIFAQLTQEPVTGNDTDPDVIGNPGSSNNSSSIDGGGGEGSKAWVAGVVVGVVAFVAIIAFLTWYYLRRRRNKSSEQTGIDLHPILQQTGDDSATWNNTSIQALPPGYSQQPKYMVPVETDGREIFEGSVKQKSPIELDTGKQL